MAAALDVVPPQVSAQGRELLRHAHLRVRHVRLERIIRELRARDGNDRRTAAVLAGFEGELEAVRRELRLLAERHASPRR
jgi:hypothetical protein